MMKFSPTAITTYMSCPRKYYLKYIVGVMEQYVPQIERGRVFHEFIEEYYKTISKDFCEEDIDFHVEETLDKLGLSYTDYANEIEGFINWEKWRIRNLPYKPKLEVEFENETFYGRLDAIFGNIVVEFKTGYVNIQLPSKYMIVQGVIYKELTGADDVIFVLIRNKGVKYFLSKMSYRAELVKNEIEYVIKRIVEGKFDEENKDECEYCLVRVACEVLKKRFAVVRLLGD